MRNSVPLSHGVKSVCPTVYLSPMGEGGMPNSVSLSHGWVGGYAQQCVSLPCCENSMRTVVSLSFCTFRTE